MLTQLQKEVERVNKIFPIIDVVCNRALKDYHWIQIKEITDTETMDLEKETLQAILDLRIAEHITELQEISERAKREKKLEDTLLRMITFWKGEKFTLLPMLDTEIQILDLRQCAGF